MSRQVLRKKLAKGGCWRGVPAAFALLSLSSPALAQDPVTQALQQYRRQMVGMLEEMMFQQTGKTTSIVYARQFRIDERNRLYCGEALFGSARQPFLLNTKTGEFVRAPTRAVQADRGCYQDDGATLIDLR